MTDVTDPRPNETTISGSRVARQQKDKNVFLLISTAAVFLSILVAVTFYVWMKRNVDHQSIRTSNGVYVLLITYFYFFNLKTISVKSPVFFKELKTK